MIRQFVGDLKVIQVKTQAKIEPWNLLVSRKQIPAAVQDSGREATDICRSLCRTLEQQPVRGKHPPSLATG